MRERCSASWRLLAALVVVLGLAVAAGCGGGGGETTAAEPPATSEAVPPATTAPPATETSAPPETGGGTAAGMIQQPGMCGDPATQGQEATGEPITLGAIATNVPGIDFTWGPKMTQAYFDCVNDNGGIHGRPVELLIEEEQIDPQQIAAFATKLVEQDQVLGLAGSMSAIECSVNNDYYAAQGYFVVAIGVNHACFKYPNFSAVNTGPYYSSLGAAATAVRMGATGAIVVVSPNQPGNDEVNSGVVEFAEAQGMKGVGLLEDVPIADPAGLAQRLVQEAGDGGAVVLDFPGPTVLPVLQAIEQQGLIDKVVWASSTPPNDPSIAKELGSAWNGKFIVNAEFNRLDSGQPDQELMNAIQAKYRSDVPISAFAQMGFLAGKVAVEALLRIEGDYTKESVNAAFKALTNVTSDLWCKPWYFDSTVGPNVGNNTDLTVTPQDQVWVQAEECFEIPDLEGNPLDQIRAKEVELGLNVG